MNPSFWHTTSMFIPPPSKREISLYFHLPFCAKKCDYCHFYVIPDKKEFKELLLTSLIKEIELKEKELKGSHIVSIYFGGGTPFLCGPPFIEQILKELQKVTSFQDLEITLEMNPENHTLGYLDSYYRLGINRLSLGAQTLEDSLLKKISRSHNRRDVVESIEKAHKAGFDNISIDLMYDLPEQTIQGFENTLRKAVKLPIKHLSLYNLSIEPHTVFYKKRLELKKKMPKPPTSLKMFQKAQQVFTQNGFEQYEISAFCKPGYQSRHNTGYWLQREHLGFGPSAYSLYQGRRFQNVPHIHKYAKALQKKELPIHFEEKLQSLPFLKESLALHLRLTLGFDLSIFEKRFGPLPNDLKKLIEKLASQEMIEIKDSYLKLSEKGLLYHDEIASEII